MLDSSITLFGRKIKLKENNIEEIIKVCEFDSGDNIASNFDDQLHNEVDKEEESIENNQQNDEYLAEDMDESTNGSATSETTDQAEKPVDSEKESKSHQDEKQSNDTKDSQQKLLKKPDKILPCPRCNSMDTKFCYYNNYNVNQPRHFCKSCQRYWTAGGTMRNVPVGAGRRKNKNSASRYCHAMSEVIQAARFDVSNHETLLTFGSDNNIKIPDKTVLNVVSSSIEDPLKKREQGTNLIPGLQFPYLWNPGIPVPAPFCPAVFPVPISPIYPHPAPWSVPWVVPHCLPPQNIPGSNPSSPNLGKHTRDGEMLTPSSTSTTVLMPKTLRIDNPDEAAKSSIWSTLGIKKDKRDSLSKGFFSNFQPKETEQKDDDIDASSALIKANPVALCRSFDFRESAN